MLSKLFQNIRFGNELWFAFFAMGFIAIQFLLLGIPTNLDYSNIGIPTMLLVGIFVVLVLLFLIFLNRLFSRSFLVFNRNYYGPIIFLAVLSFIWPLYELEGIIVMYVLLFFYYNLFQISERPLGRIIPYLINIGLASFLAFLISPVGILFIVLSWIHSSLQGAKGWRQFAVPLYIFLLALGVYYLLAFSFDFLPIFFAHVGTLNINIATTEIVFEYKVLLIVSLILFLFGLREFGIALSKAPVAKRKVMALVVWQCLLSFVLMFLYNFDKGLIISGMLSLALLFANHFQYLKKYWIKEIWIWVLLFLAVFPLTIDL